MAAFILIVAGLLLVWYLLQRRRPKHNLDNYSSTETDVRSGGDATAAADVYAGGGGTFGGAGASGDWSVSESSGAGGGGGDGGGGGGGGGD